MCVVAGLTRRAFLASHRATGARPRVAAVVRRCVLATPRRGPVLRRPLLASVLGICCRAGGGALAHTCHKFPGALRITTDATHLLVAHCPLPQVLRGPLAIRGVRPL